MKGNKIIATLVVLAMVLSTLVVLNVNIVEKAGAKAPLHVITPGVNAWGNATTELVYGVSYSSVAINTSEWTGVGPFYMYYPSYRSAGTGGNANSFVWAGPYLVGAYNVRVATAGLDSAALDTGGSAITFNRSGMWIFDNDATHAGNDNTSYAGYIWVNSSTNYTIDSISDFQYGATGSVTVTVNTGTDSGCMIAIMGPNNATIYHKWRATGVSESMEIAGNFTLAGDYTVKAYRDFDGQNSTYYYPDEYLVPGGVTENYSDAYGSNYTGYFPSHTDYAGDVYNYTYMGPWDPPEKTADEKTFTVTTGKPNIVLTNTTIYWGFETRIDINVTDSDGNGIAVNTGFLTLKFGSKYTKMAFINSTGLGNYTLVIPRYDPTNTSGTHCGWQNLSVGIGSSNVNGTWRVVFGYDKPTADGTYEWNNSASFIVKSANPPVQIVVANDGSGTATDRKVNVPAYVSGANQAATIDIVFDIFGRSIADVYNNAYYGDDGGEDWKNITVEGDILYPVTAATLVHSALGRWTATVTPTKPGGTITISVDWPGDHNGTATQTIEIVNGTFVASAVESFTVGEDYNLTVTITDMDGSAVKNAYVILMWQDVPLKFNNTNGTNKAGNGLNGEYTFWIQPNDKDATTPGTAPQNITVAARWYGNFWGYTKVIMARNHNMKVNMTPTTAYAGDSVLYDITVSLVGGGNPSATGLTVALYNSTGEIVTGDDAWTKAGDYSITEEELILSGGQYYIYAYNATHDSAGNNASLIVTNYTVTCSPATLAWKIDTAVNMTFQLLPAGNGTLTVNNMTSLPNASYPGQSTQISVENGVGTLDEVNATTLGNVTFTFTPDGGQARHADGLLRVTTATATPSPATIYNGEPTLVTITVTHPSTGIPLEGVRVGLDHGMVLNESILAKFPTDQFTGADGKAQFSITADASGNITIYIENETDPDNEFVIVAKARMQMTISNDPSVEEGKSFTITAKTNGVIITDATVTFTFNGQTWPTTTGVATITAPTSVPASLSYPITATADGYTTATGTIMVLNVPKLTIIPPSGDVKGKQKFTVTIANDEGSGVTGAKVTFNGGEFYSGVNGACELTAPDVTEEFQNFQITATFTGYTDATPVTQKILKTPGVPGFELITLLAAIGVAFLLLRRRRK